MSSRIVLPRPRSSPADENSYVDPGGAEHEVPLAEAAAVRFEQAWPVRRFTFHPGQRHLSGLWWSATTGGHVGFESRLERDHLMALDFCPLAAISNCLEAAWPVEECDWRGDLRPRGG
jgi:hypothetical protein